MWDPFPIRPTHVVDCNKQYAPRQQKHLYVHTFITAALWRGVPSSIRYLTSYSKTVGNNNFSLELSQRVCSLPHAVLPSLPLTQLSPRRCTVSQENTVCQRPALAERLEHDTTLFTSFSNSSSCSAVCCSKQYEPQVLHSLHHQLILSRSHRHSLASGHVVFDRRVKATSNDARNKVTVRQVTWQHVRRTDRLPLSERAQGFTARHPHSTLSGYGLQLPGETQGLDCHLLSPARVSIWLHPNHHLITHLA